VGLRTVLAYLAYGCAAFAGGTVIARTGYILPGIRVGRESWRYSLLFGAGSAVVLDLLLLNLALGLGAAVVGFVLLWRSARRPRGPN